jgi:hypothetical protein
MNSREESNQIRLSPKRFFYKSLLSFLDEFNMIEFGVSDPSADTDELLPYYTLHHIRFKLGLKYHWIS